MGWDEARIEQAKALWLDGKSATYIAKAIGGTTRNAVIGIAHRKGWTALVNHAGNRQLVRPKYAKAPRPAPAPKPPKPAPPPPRERDEDGHLEAFDIPDPVAAEEAGEPIGLLDLTSRTCRYPVNAPPLGQMEDTLFCGARPREGDAYCPAHAERCYSAAKLARLSRLGSVDRNVRTRPAPASFDRMSA